MNKRIVTWMLAAAFLQVPSVWAENQGPVVSEPTEPMAMTVAEAGSPSAVSEVVAHASAVEEAMIALVVPPPPPIEGKETPPPLFPDLEDEEEIIPLTPPPGTILHPAAGGMMPLFPGVEPGPSHPGPMNLPPLGDGPPLIPAPVPILINNGPIQIAFAPAAVPAGPAAPKAPETAQNPKPGIYSEEKLKQMIEEAKKKGQIVFIQISATWCGPCAQSIKDMQEMMDKYGKEGAIYIVVEVGATGQEMEAYKKKYPNTIFVIVEGESPPKDFPASSYPAIYYSSGTAWVPAPAGAPSEATLKQWQEAMKKWADEMKKAAGGVGN